MAKPSVLIVLCLLPVRHSRHKCRIVKCDLSESTLLAERYRIHAVPTFLVYACSLLDVGKKKKNSEC